MKASWMVVAGLFFGCMTLFVKLGANRFSDVELVFYRSLFGLVTIAVIVVARRYPLRTSYVRMHLWRSLSGFAALMLFFHSITLLPLATAVTLNYTAPLFLAVLSSIVLRERPHALLVAALVVGFVGVTLLLRPSLSSHESRAALLGLLSGFLGAVAYLNIKQLALTGEPDWRTVFYFTLVSTLGAGGWMVFNVFHPVDLYGFVLLCGLGMTATLAQLALTRAYREGHTLVVGSLAYSTVIFSSLFGAIVLGDRLDATAWLAIGLVILSGVASVWTVRNRSPFSTPPL